MKPWMFGLAGLAACSEYDVVGDPEGPLAVDPAIEVDPLELDFWQVSVGETVELSFHVRNIGGAPLTIDSIVVAGDPAFSLVDPETGFWLDPSEEREIPVAFTPSDPLQHTAFATVLSNDPERPEVEVSLLGAGKGPWLEITPSTWDFGVVDIPCGESVELTLRNAGNDDLAISSATYAADPGLALVATLPGPVSLVPGGFTTVWVDFSPVVAAPVAGLLSVASDDPRGVVTADQLGDAAYIGNVNEAWVAPTDSPVDILFAVDQSCSMDDDSVALGANFATFIAELGTVTAGWNVGVVTYDSACVNHGILAESVVGYDSLFQDAVLLGADFEVSDDERLFQIVDRALAQTVVGGCNEGLLRPGSPLHVILVSDEPERSVEEASLWDWAWFQPRFEGYVSSPALLKVSGVVDLDGCSEGSAGYVEMIDATGGEKLSICLGNWSSYATTLATATLTGAYVMPLSQPCDPNSLTVTIDGVPSSAWTYDPVLNALVLDGVTAGATVVADYGVAASCP